MRSCALRREAELRRVRLLRDPDGPPRRPTRARTRVGDRRPTGPGQQTMSHDTSGMDDPLEAMIRTVARKFSRGEASVLELASQVGAVIDRADATAPPDARALINEIVVWLAHHQHGNCSEAEFRAALGELADRR